MRKVVSALLIVSLMSMSLAACSNKTKETKEETALGRYVESELELPECLQNGNGSIFSMKLQEDQSLELLGLSYQDGFLLFTYSNGEIVQEKLDTMNDLISNNLNIDEITLGQNGSYYLLFDDFTEYRKDNTAAISQRLFQWRDGQSQEITLSFLTDKISITDVQATKTGDLVLQMGDQYGQDSSVVYYCVKEKKITAKCDASGSFALSDDCIYVISPEAGSVIEYAFEGTPKNEYPCDFDLTDAQIVTTKDKLVVASKAGISELSIGSTLWENRVDGSLVSLADSRLQMQFLQAASGESDCYYICYKDTTNQIYLDQYQYDPDIPAVPENTVTIYSLYTNPFLSMAIAEYQREHSDIKIDYKIAYTDESGASLTETVHSLNASLLAGDGPDMLLLDGLPEDSYRAKGVLANLSDVISPLVDSNVLVPTIADDYLKEDQCDEFPLRISIPVVYGTKEAVKASQSLDEFANYVAENPNVFKTTFQYITSVQCFVILYYKDIFNGDKTLNEENMETFLRMMMNLTESCDEVNYYDVFDDFSYQATALSEFVYFIQNEGEPTLTIYQMVNHTDPMIPMYFSKQGQFSYDTFQKSYLPQGLFGMNAASNNQDICKDFLNFLLSDSAQSLDIDNGNALDGISVGLTNFQQWFADTDYYSDRSLGCSDSQGGFLIDGIDDTEYTQKFLNTCSQIDQPMSYDQTLVELVSTDITTYLQGTSDLQTTLSDLSSTVKSYLAE